MESSLFLSSSLRSRSFARSLAKSSPFSSASFLAASSFFFRSSDRISPSAEPPSLPSAPFRPLKSLLWSFSVSAVAPSTRASLHVSRSGLWLLGPSRASRTFPLRPQKRQSRSRRRTSRCASRECNATILSCFACLACFPTPTKTHGAPLFRPQNRTGATIGQSTTWIIDCLSDPVATKFTGWQFGRSIPYKYHVKTHTSYKYTYR